MQRKISEQQLHKQICDYLLLQYPKVLFNTDMSGVKLPKGLAVKASKLRSHKGMPDIQIFESSGKMVVKYDSIDLVVFQFSGLFLEVKKETPYKKNGELKSDEHLKEQDNLHKLLRKQGYFVSFVWTFEMAKKIIDDYLRG